MSQSVVSPAVVYPCSDGHPMGESVLHIAELEIRLRDFERAAAEPKHGDS